MQRVAQREEWYKDRLDDPRYAGGGWREAGIASLITGEDDVGAVRGFFTEALEQIKQDLAGFEEEHTGGPWKAV